MVYDLIFVNEPHTTMCWVSTRSFSACALQAYMFLLKEHVKLLNTKVFISEWLSKTQKGLQFKRHVTHTRGFFKNEARSAPAAPMGILSHLNSTCGAKLHANHKEELLNMCEYGSLSLSQKFINYRPINTSIVHIGIFPLPTYRRHCVVSEHVRWQAAREENSFEIIHYDYNIYI